MPKRLWAPMGLVGMPTLRDHKFCIRSPFGMIYIPLERSSREVHISIGPDYAFSYRMGTVAPKKNCLRPQNGPRSLEPKKV
jgi:hypothetical protein